MCCCLLLRFEYNIVMIDLLKNYKELKTAPGYISSIQYYLAKKKLDVCSNPYRRYS